MRIVRGVSITPDSVEIAYMDDASDLRADGSVYQVHTISVSREDTDLEEHLEAMETAVDSLLAAGIRRWSTTPPVTPQQINDRLRAEFELDVDDEEEDER